MLLSRPASASARVPAGALRLRRHGLRRAIALLAVVAMLYVALAFGQVWRTADTDQAAPADAIVVLGAAHYQGRPSPVFAARLDHAATLYQQGIAPLVVVTGGRGDGDSLSEANAADAYLQQRGVPADALRLEVNGRTTYESLAASARFLLPDGITDVVLVSDGWHLRRSTEIAAEVGLSASGSPAPGSPYSTTGAIEQMLRETAGLVAGRAVSFRRADALAELLG